MHLIAQIRQMTAKDEDILTSRALLQKGIAIDRLIDGTQNGSFSIFLKDS